MNKKEFEYNRMMKRTTKNIKKVDDEFTDALAELIINKRSTCGAFLWQEELVYDMHLYITYLGFIDSLIVCESKDMNLAKKTNDVGSYNEHEEKYNNYLEQRNRLINLIKTKTNIINKFKFLNEVLKSIPALNKFNFLYEDLLAESYQLNLQLEFINAYNNGFMQEGYVNYNYITNKFEKYCEEIEKHKDNNRKAFTRIKILD